MSDLAERLIKETNCLPKSDINKGIKKLDWLVRSTILVCIVWLLFAIANVKITHNIEMETNQANQLIIDKQLEMISKTQDRISEAQIFLIQHIHDHEHGNTNHTHDLLSE